MENTIIYGMALSYGCFTGPICRDLLSVEQHQVLLIKQSAIGQLNTIPGAIIIYDATAFAHINSRIYHLGIPIISISTADIQKLLSGQIVHVNGNTGSIKFTQDPNSKSETSFVNSNPLILDNQPIKLRVSVGTMQCIEDAKKFSADAIGLLRSERFLPESSQINNTEFYYQTFEKICQLAAPLSVTVRLLDIAKDKLPIECKLDQTTFQKIGYQGSRLFFDDVLLKIFLHQVDAINSLAPHYPLKIIIPFITHSRELKHWRHELKSHLCSSVPVAAMVENPAAALSINELLDDCDFVAIGCNDLMQYFFAADRTEPRLASYLDPYCPALFRFLRQVFQQSQTDAENLQMCGLLSQIPGVILILAGLGYRVFSVEPTNIPHLKMLLSRFRIEQLIQLADQVCEFRHSNQVNTQLREFLGSY